MSSSGSLTRTSYICVPDANSLIDSRGKLHIVYQIQIRSGSYQRTISKKYSEFRLFDKIWRLMYSSIDVKLPPKIWIGNKSDKVVADRKMGLTKYLNALIVLETLWASLSKFLSVPLEILERMGEEIKTLGPCCDKYGSGCQCIQQQQQQQDTNLRNNENSIRLLNLSNQYSDIAVSNQTTSDTGTPRISPPSQSSDRTTSQLRCIRRFEARTPGQLSLFVGEIVQELKTANGWYYGRNAQGQEGYFPSDHVQKL